MTDINLKTLTPDTSLPTTGFLFGADSQASTNPSVYSTQTVATTLLGSTSLTGDTLTASAPVLNLTQTWNSSGTTFTGLKFNVTNTLSASASLIADLQVDTVSGFSIGKNTSLVLGTITNKPGFLGQILPGTDGEGKIGDNYARWGEIWVFKTINIRGSTGAFSLAANDGSNALYLTRKGAANLQLGQADAASPVAQTLSVQSIVAGQTNASAAAYPFTITGAQGTGTGAGGSIVFKVAPAGGSGNAQNTLADALTIASDKSISIFGDLGSANNDVVIGGGSFGKGVRFVYAGWILNTSAGIGFFNEAKTGAPLIVLGGTTSSFPAIKRSSTTMQVRLADDSAFAPVQGKLTTDNAYTAGAVVQTGYVTIYDSTGTAYKVLVGT